ncbi:MAG: ABC transporter substrate-binding protein [Acidimicrobiia bacterium]
MSWGPPAVARVLALVAAVLVAGACGRDRPAPLGFTPVEQGTLTVATALPAPGFWETDRDGRAVGGFEHGIAAALAERFDLALEVRDVPFDRIVAGDLGGADLALAQIAVTGERAEALALSTPYLTVDAGAVVARGQTLADLEEARSLRWVVERGTTEVGFVEQVVRPAAAPLVVADRAATLAALDSGRADAALLDLRTALATAHASGGALDVPAQFRTGDRVVAALPRDAARGAENLEAVDAALRNLAASGRLRELEGDELLPALGRDPAEVPVILTRQPR